MKKEIGILFVVCFLCPSLLEAQCAMCRAALESGDDQEIAKGINNGIIYLMAIPYILIGALGYFIYKKIKS